MSLQNYCSNSDGDYNIWRHRRRPRWAIVGSSKKATLLLIVLMLVQSSCAVKHTIYRPSTTTSLLRNDQIYHSHRRQQQRRRRSPVSNSAEEQLTGGTLSTGCWNADVYVAGTKFIVEVDSGSSDFLVPGATLNGYAGPTYSTAGKRPIFSDQVGTVFADSSSWTGHMYEDTISIAGLHTTAPIAVVETQSSPQVIDGFTSQGLLGIAFDSLSSNQDHNPFTVLTALVSSNIIARDLVAFRGCPANSPLQSYIDWGAEDPSLTCAASGEPTGWAAVISRDHYSVNVTGISVGSHHIPLDNFGGDAWQDGTSSIVDSCTTLLVLPNFAHTAFIDAIIASGALKAANLPDQVINDFLYKLTSIPSDSNIDYAKLPVLTIDLAAADAGTGGTVSLSLRGVDYFQDDTTGNLFFPVGAQDSANIILGSVIFESFYIVLDRANARVGFGPGCGCQNGSSALDSLVKVYYGGHSPSPSTLISNNGLLNNSGQNNFNSPLPSAATRTEPLSSNPMMSFLMSLFILFILI